MSISREGGSIILRSKESYQRWHKKDHVNVLYSLMMSILVYIFFYFWGCSHVIALSEEKWKIEKSSSEMISKKHFYTLRIFSKELSDNFDVINMVNAVSILATSKDKSFSNSARFVAQAREDYLRILAALYERGFFGGSISITIDKKEVADIPIDTNLLENIEIIIRVSLGKIYRFANVNITNASYSGSFKEEKQKLLYDIGYIRGHRAESNIILKAEKLAIEIWKRQGYPKAKIINRTIIVDHAVRSVDVNIQVDEGKKAVFGQLSIRNISRIPHMDTLYIVKMTGLVPGDLYHPDAIKKANKRLAKLDVFSAAIIRETDHLTSNGQLPLELVLEEYALHRIGAGIAFSTFEGAGLESYWLHRNLFGKAERLRFDARLGNIGGNSNHLNHFEKHDYRISINYIKPGILTADTDLIAMLEGEKDIASHYISSGTYLHSGLSRDFTDNFSVCIYANASQIRIREHDSKYNKFTMYGFRSGMIYDTRDRKADSHTGKYGEFIVEPFYEVGHSNFSVSVTGEGRSYFMLDNIGRFIFAARVKIGTIMGSNKMILPANKLFFAGGSSSIRGYASRDIGLVTEEKKIIGGRSLLEGSAELRSMLTNYVGVTTFIDAGIIGKNFFFNDENKKIGIGIGLRYITGIGPIRFDVAKPLNDYQNNGIDKKRSAISFYIGIGQAF